MLSYFKTEDGRMMQLPASEPGCWINCISPDDREINSLISDFGIEADFFRAAMDEEESSHIDHEDENTLIVIDSPVVEKEGRSITYTTMPLGIIITEKNVITVSIRDNPVMAEFAQGAVRGVQTNLKTRFMLSIMLRVATRFLQYLKQIDKISNFVETELRRSMRNAELLQLLDIEKSLVYFSSSLKGNEITLEKIMRGRVVKLYDDDEDLLEDVLIEVKQAIDMSNIYLNIVSGTMGASTSVISNNLNVAMKRLAVIVLLAAVPLTVFGLFAAGAGAPFFWLPAAVAAAAAGGLYAFFHVKKMI